MKLKIKDAVIAKEILNKDICNSIMYIAKEEGRMLTEIYFTR